MTVSGILMKLSLTTADTVFFYHAGILFLQQCSGSCNKIVQWFQMIGLCRAGFKGGGQGARAPGLPPTEGLPPNPSYFICRSC